MNILDIDIQDSIPAIIEAYTKVFGEEYREIIAERINKVVYIFYNTIEGVESYYEFLLQCKDREIWLKILKFLGHDVSEQEGKSYAEKFDEELLTFIDIYTEKGTKDNLLNSKEGEHFLEEYETYKQEIGLYKKYARDEENRKTAIHDGEKRALFHQLSPYLPEKVRVALDEQCGDINEKSKFLFDDIGIKSYIEYFSEEDEAKLNDPAVSENEKEDIYYFRNNYFQNLKPELLEHIEDFETDKEFYEYCMGQESVKALIPSAEVAKKTTSFRNEAYERFQREFLHSSSDLIMLENFFPGNKNSMYEMKRDKAIGVRKGIDGTEIRPFLYYTIVSKMNGKLDKVFLHEIAHIIELEDIPEGYRAGFDYIGKDMPVNPYNKTKRKYERLSETIADIVAIEARQILHEQDIYIMEPKELVDPDIQDNNTHSIVKNLVTTLLEKYRAPVVRARLLGDMEGLYDAIGQENFEQLNDVVNRVDYLVEFEGLEAKLETNQNDDPTLVEYHAQLARLEQIYARMEAHQSRNSAEDKDDKLH
ncbi:MAG: hypothetical protein FWC68_00650 [Oscillospiraceae bacterium]|nr:hypothetical protein [Oscillospiraceae bacterium]